MKQGEKTKKLILETSGALFYHKGYANTSFGDIMHATGLSKGNITYHFKTKPDILKGIIDQRLKKIHTLIAQWERDTSDPKARLRCFCQMIKDQAENLERYGCPLGTITSEFSKNQPELHELALPMFGEFRVWLTKEFQRLGVEDADYAALSLISKVQGVALVTHVFKERAFLEREIAAIIKELEKG